MKYRSEIDGLRTFAIIPVVAFHAGIEILSGGFIGVDIFFVISGYLISKIIIDEINAGRFSIVEFYKRRILRILPALSVVLVAVMLAGYLLMMPNEFAATGKSIVATVLFVSNIYFWRDVNYFAGSAESKPLLHTWSLSVEEQFYVFFPIALLIISRFLGRRYIFWIALAIIASFALNVVMISGHQSAAFYLLPTRVWELGLGALIAAGGIPSVPRVARDALTALGLALILFGIFYLTEQMPFPGWNALYPCIGAGLIIAYGSQTQVGRLLSLAPIVFIGRISYSLYLWHWPVIGFLSFLNGRVPSTPLEIAAAIAISFLLAIASYYFVEMPFRRPHLRAVSGVKVLSAGGGVLVALGLLGAFIIRDSVRIQNYPENALFAASYLDYKNTDEQQYQFRKGMCFGEQSGTTVLPYVPEKCLILDPNRKNYIVIGDSHAAHIWRALSEEYPDTNFIQVSITGCRPTTKGSGDKKCRDLFESIFNDFIIKNKVDGIFLAGRWLDEDMPYIPETIDYLKGHVGEVIVLGPTIEYSLDFPGSLARKIYWNSPRFTENGIIWDRRRLSDQMQEMARLHGARFGDLISALCTEARCIETTADGVPIQYDYGHLTLPGARLVTHALHDQIAPRSDAPTN